MTDHDDELNESDLDSDQKAALRLACLPEAKLRALPMKELRKAYEDAATDFVVTQFLRDEDRERVASVWNARREERRPVPKIETKKRKRRSDFKL